MIKVALTGNIASGKSTVQKIIEDSGYKVFCTDVCAHRLIKNNLDVIRLYGTDERSKIAKIVFSEPEKLRALEKILHPLIIQELEDYFLKNSKEKFVFAALPQLFEAGFEKMFDKIIFVSSPYEVRLKRLMKRCAYSEDYAKLRLDSQWEESEKIPKSDIVILNDGSLEDLKNRTTKALKLLL